MRGLSRYGLTLGKQHGSSPQETGWNRVVPLETDVQFLLAIHKDPDSAYGVTVQDVPGCFSAGDTLGEAIAGHLSVMLDDGEPLPPVRSFEEHQANPAYANTIWAYTQIDLEQLSDKAERVNITLPRRVL